MPKLFENLWAKLAALLLAFLLWFHVATDKIFQHETILLLTQIDLNDELALTEPPPAEFNVIVSASGKRLLRSDWKKAGLRLMIDRTRPGRAKIGFDQNNLSLVKADNIELINIVSPREEVLEFDQKEKKELPIKSMVIINPGKGFLLNNNDSLIPNTVTISGPRRLLNEIDSIETSYEYVDGVRNSLSMKVALAYPDIYGIELEPDTVEYFVEVSPIKTRVFSDIEIKLINHPDGDDSLISIQPERLEIRVGGLPDIVDSLLPEMFSAMVNYRKFDSLGVAPIELGMPGQLSILSKSVDSVRLTRK